ncbi:MAG: hypothetical protein FI703_00215 [SAR202 cluster bacterium]|nr:hypothetical protein [SAR202 cluster bacterium]
MTTRFVTTMLMAIALLAIIAACSSGGTQTPASTPPSAGAQPIATAPAEPTPVPIAPTPAPIDNTLPGFEMVSAPAQIESVEVIVSDTDPTDVSLKVISILNSSSCSSFEGFTQTLEGNTINVTLTHLVVVPGQLVACTADIGFIETIMPIQAVLTPGETYDVIVNGEVTNGFVARDTNRGGWITSPATVETVDVVTSGTDITDVSLVLISPLPMGSICSQFAGYDVDRNGNIIRVTMTNLHIAPGVLAPCTADLPIIETTIPLGNDFEVGQSYSVVVNDKVTNTFLARDPEGQAMKLALAPIEDVELLMLESFPVQYNVVIASRLPRGSSCSQHYGYDVAHGFDTTIAITVYNLEVADENAPCTRDLPVVQTTVALGTDFQSGETYTVIVNGQVTEEFVAQ